MMAARLHRLSELQRYDLCATDGEIASIGEVYFEAATWMVRYLVVNAGSWLKDRRALISVVAVGDMDEAKNEIPVEIPSDRIKDGPTLTNTTPVSRQYETDYFRYYGWPPYWESASFSRPLSACDQSATFPAERRQAQRTDKPLCSSKEVTDYHIAAKDGEIGLVKDLVIDERKWSISYLEIDTGDESPSRYVLLNPAWIAEINWSMRRVVMDLRRRDIRSAPAYDPESVIGQDYEIKLLEHYARCKY